MTSTSKSLIREIPLKLTILDARDLARGHRFSKPIFCAKVILGNGEEFFTRPSINSLWNEEFTTNINAESRLRLEVICKHKKTADDHIIGVVENVDILGLIAKPHMGIIEVDLSKPGRDKITGHLRYEIEVLKTTRPSEEKAHLMSLSWRALNSADIIRKVVFEGSIDDLVPPSGFAL